MRRFRGLSPLVFLLIFALSGFQAGAVILYHETFDGPDLPSGWGFDTDGIWSIVDGELDQSRLTAPGHMDAWAGDFINWTDYSVEVEFMFLEFGTHDMNAGLGLRHTQANTGGEFFVTRVSWRNSFWNIEVVKTLAPEIHLPLNQNLTLNTWYTMKSQIEGDFLKVWVNDVFYDFGDISDAPYLIPSAGNIGVWTNEAHVRFDNLIVRSLHPEPVIPEPMTFTLFSASLLGLGIWGRKKGR